MYKRQIPQFAAVAAIATAVPRFYMLSYLKFSSRILLLLVLYIATGIATGIATDAATGIAIPRLRVGTAPVLPCLCCGLPALSSHSFLTT